MSIQTIRTNGMTMRFFRFGNPLAQPFLILPGLALRSVLLSAPFIEAQYKPLSDAFDMYVIDRRADLPAAYTIPDMADDTIRAMDAMNLRNTVLYGVSQGGMIALTIAAKRPDLVENLVICSTADYIPPNAGKILDEWCRLAGQRDIPALMQSFSKHVYSQAYCAQYADAIAKFGQTVTEEDLCRFIVTCKGSTGFDIRDDLHSIQCPILALAGEQDAIFGTAPTAHIIEQTGGELYIYPNAPHSIYDEDADVLKRIRAHLLR